MLYAGKIIQVIQEGPIVFSIMDFSCILDFEHSQVDFDMRRCFPLLIVGWTLFKSEFNPDLFEN